jgi:hypothetical protein
MLSGYDLGSFGRGRDHCASGQMIGLAKQSAGSLVNGCDRLLIKRDDLQAGDAEVMGDIGFRALPVDGLKMSTGNDPGGKRDGAPVEEIVGEVVLAGKDYR